MFRINPFKGLALIFCLVFNFACNNNNEDKTKSILTKEPPKQQYIEQIKLVEKEIHESKEISNTIANKAIKAYTEFAHFFPKDTLAPDYLFKAAEIATSLNSCNQAMIYYKNITDSFPNYKLIQESLYLQGYLWDNFLNDNAKAKTIYEEVMAKYPNGIYANDAKTAINNLGKSDEDLIKEFKKKNGQN